jgi:hypothetical protein
MVESEITMNTAITIRLPQNTPMLPDSKGWTNRFEIRSQSSGRVYIVAQRTGSRSWGCSCPGWLRYRKCKHLEAIGLPCFEQPFEAKLVR